MCRESNNAKGTFGSRAICDVIAIKARFGKQRSAASSTLGGVISPGPNLRPVFVCTVFLSVIMTARAFSQVL